MKPLHDQARRVIAEARSPDAAPPESSAARNWQALESRLDAPLPPRAAAADHSLHSQLGGSVWSSALLKLALCSVVLAGLGGGLALYGKDTSARVPVGTLATRSQQAAPPALANAQLTTADPSAAPAADHVAVVARSPARAHRLPPTAAGLATETRLIAQAQGKLNDGAAARALALLDQHRAQFPHGELVPEREAARVLALCALGRAAEAKAARARFERDFASSPLLLRVRGGCVPVSQ